MTAPKPKIPLKELQRLARIASKNIDASEPGTATHTAAIETYRKIIGSIASENRSHAAAEQAGATREVGGKLASMLRSNSE